MDYLEKQRGPIGETQTYYNKMIGNAVTGCFGVVSMGKLRKKQQFPNQSVRVSKSRQGLQIDLHVVIAHGLNISSIQSSIVNRVRYTLKEITGLDVKTINVFVDGLRRAEA